MAIETAVSHEVVNVRVVLERRTRDGAGRVVYEASEESEGFGLMEPDRTNAVRELHFEAAGLVMQLRDRSVDVRLDQGKVGARRQPLADRRSGIGHQLPQTTVCGTVGPKPLVDEHQVQVELE